MQSWSRAFLHKQLNTLLEACSANELRGLLIALGDEEHSRRRQPFFERVQRHRLAQGGGAANAVDDDDLRARLDAMAMELAATAESEEPGWWEEEDELGPFEALMPGVLTLLEEVGAQLRQGDAVSACQAYERIWAMLEVEDDYGRRPSLESHDRDTAREHAARYLRAVLLASDPGEQVTAMLEAVERVRFSGFTANLAQRYLTLREVAEVEATPIAGWADFLDVLLTALAEPEDALQAMWLREAALCLTAPAEEGNDEQGGGASSPSRKVGKTLEQLAKRENPGRYLANVSQFENWAPVVVLAWLLVGERQRAKALAAEQGGAVGWSLGDNPLWALFCCLPVMLAGRSVEERGAATQAMWRQLVQSGTWDPWGNGSAEQATNGAGRDKVLVAGWRQDDPMRGSRPVGSVWQVPARGHGGES